MAGGSPLLARPFLAVLAATLATFGGYSLLLPVLPLWVASGGAGPGLAGSVTGVFMAATVLTQLAVPALLRAIGHRAALVLAAVALGAPAALLVLTPSVWLAMPVSVVRGAGFGVLTVAGAALVSDLVPARVRGRATGIYGLALGLPQLVLLTGGVWAWARLGPSTVLLTGAVLPLVALPAMGLLPRRVGASVPEVVPPVVSPVVSDAVSDGARRSFARAAVAPWLVMLVCAASAGGVITVLPLAQPAGPAAGALFALTAAQLVGRSVSGELGDRLGLGGRVTAPALGVAALGAGVVAWGLTGAGTAAVLGGAGLVGLGFGAVQNDTLVTLFTRAGPGRSGTASSVWNTAYDTGTGLGATALSAVLGAAGAPWSFVVAALACVLALGSAPWLRPDPTGTPG
ncbi:MFS transporter [Actinomycetospora endophytica]|uniref:MFS transporter n=1 Tax=Actinomycetospora endophytica TaxID=2291215 RepID=A0ABS8P7R1_9PSEU|nr:MFS transporter [Actinomycetospora endophytica]MCD2194290.1 MFS transporter [Actinomycetospora endophytica]